MFSKYLEKSADFTWTTLMSTAENACSTRDVGKYELLARGNKNG